MSTSNNHSFYPTFAQNESIKKSVTYDGVVCILTNKPLKGNPEKQAVTRGSIQQGGSEVDDPTDTTAEKAPYRNKIVQ